jgi:hypothetical protein
MVAVQPGDLIKDCGVSLIGCDRKAKKKKKIKEQSK